MAEVLREAGDKGAAEKKRRRIVKEVERWKERKKISLLCSTSSSLAQVFSSPLSSLLVEKQHQLFSPLFNDQKGRSTLALNEQTQQKKHIL